jgi:pyridoxal phosphate enzyme (YggS family)
MSITDAINKYKDILGSTVKLVAVSKTKPESAIMEAYQAGQRDFGENKIQEMTAKAESLPRDIRWHMIGNIQTNKIKYMAPYVHLVHGVDREKVLKELNKQGQINGRVISCLLQIHIAEEDTKFGFDYSECIELIDRLDEYKNVNVTGLMGMATNTNDQEQINKEFMGLKEFFDAHAVTHHWDTLSMGMSGDYELAIAAGSTHVRIGSAIFGARNYTS